MTAERPDSTEGRVIQLRPRRPLAGGFRRTPSGLPLRGRGPLDLGSYERGSSERDDYRERMIVNVLALAVCVLLVLSGVWLANKIVEMRQNQDCVLSGRPGCTHVDVPVRNRW